MIFTNQGKRRTLLAAVYANPNPAVVSLNAAATVMMEGVAGMIGAATANGSASMAADTLRAVPFISPARGGVLEYIMADIATLNVGTNINIGLYENVSDQRDCYPGTRLDASGSISASTTGVKRFGVNRVLSPGRLYWLVLNTDATIVMRGVNLADVWNGLGMGQADTTGLNTYISVASTFASAPMPATFPAGGAYLQTVPPAMRYRFAA